MKLSEYQKGYIKLIRRFLIDGLQVAISIVVCSFVLNLIGEEFFNFESHFNFIDIFLTWIWVMIVIIYTNIKKQEKAEKKQK